MQKATSFSSTDPVVALQPVELRIGSEYRRCCWYLLSGGIAVAAFIATLSRLGIGRGDGSQWFVGALLLLGPTLLLFTAESWRMRIDTEGIARRRWWMWSTWGWDAFLAGDVHRELGSGRYTYPARPLWDRHLILDFLSERDRETVDRLCRVAIGEPQIASHGLPTRIVANGWPRRLLIVSEGISLPEFFGSDKVVPWDEVPLVRFHWQRHKSRLHCQVELQTKGAPPLKTNLSRIRAIDEDGVTKSPVNEIELVERFAAQFLSTDRLISFQTFDPPRNSREAAHQVSYFKSQLRFSRVLLFLLNFIGLAASALFLFMKLIPGGKALIADPFMPWGWKAVAIVCGVLTAMSYPVIIGAVSWSILSRLDKQLRLAKGYVSE